MGSAWAWLILFCGVDLCLSQTKLLTYNAGLLQTIPNKQERADYILTNLRATDPDIVCLQEVRERERDK